jgi:hypothetical protein
VTFEHIIMTRFNLATPGKEAAIRNQAGWLERRFALFERYCLPTVAAQDCRDFRWLVYFDEDTPAQFRERIEADRRIHPFTPYFTGLFPSEGWRNSVAGLLGAERPEMVLTTVLDNDDGLAVDFVSRLHAQVREHHARQPCAFNFTNGYVLNGRRLFAHAHLSNAFANVLERYDGDIRTASAIRHMDLARHLTVIQVPGPGAWLQVVHGENVSNKTRGRRVGRKAAEQRFPAAVMSEVIDPARSERIAEALVAGPIRSGRDLLIKAIRSVGA